MYRLALAVMIVVALGGITVVHSDTFSVDEASPSAAAADILTPGPMAHVPGPSIGLGMGDDLNALSSGWDRGSILYFSVDRASVGLAGSVLVEAANGQAAGDIFVTSDRLTTFAPPQGQNTLMINQANWGLAPLILPGVPAGGAVIDNVDAFNFDEFDISPGDIGSVGDQYIDRDVYFSLALGSASLTGGLSADDIFIAQPAATPGPVSFSIFADGVTDIGLQADDDIDALALLTDHCDLVCDVEDSALFSLAPGSPSLGGLYSAADIFITHFDGQFELFANAASLGLEPGDNVDALEVQPVVPEPATLILLGAGLLGLVAYRRRK